MQAISLGREALAPTRPAQLALFPETAAVNQRNHLEIGGCDLVEVAREFGTPLYLFDEVTLRARCREFQHEFSRRYPQVTILYACKAFINRALASLFKDEGLGLDVVSGGEMSIAHSIDFPMERVYFHGNNKSEEELRLALQWGVGRIVVDNLYELGLLQRLAVAEGITVPILLRLSPGVEAHTHTYTTTGITDSKFGFPMVTGQAWQAVSQAISAQNLRLLGLHFHLGSPIFELGPYREAIGSVLEFAAQMHREEGLLLEEFSPGGGFAVQYTLDTPAPSVAQYAEAITSTLLECCQKLGLVPPRLILEPGRAIIARAGVALYSLGAIKEIPGVRKYASLDGGMADNIRPALYSARYEALLANRIGAEGREKVTLAGKFCESGDILIKDIKLPPLAPGDLVAIPVSGAYALAMASNYNASLRPPILLVKEGRARLIRRRESYEDLMRCDLLEASNVEAHRA